MRLARDEIFLGDSRGRVSRGRGGGGGLEVAFEGEPLFAKAAYHRRRTTGVTVQRPATNFPFFRVGERRAAAAAAGRPLA